MNDTGWKTTYVLFAVIVALVTAIFSYGLGIESYAEDFKMVCETQQVVLGRVSKNEWKIDAMLDAIKCLATSQEDNAKLQSELLHLMTEEVTRDEN